jgi:hypothetical protein
MRLSAKYKRQYARLKSAKPRDPASIPPEKVKAAVEKLARSHKRKKEQIAVLKDIVTRQHEALQRIFGASASNAVISLRSLIHQMATCDHADRPGLVSQALHALDSLHERIGLLKNQPGAIFEALLEYLNRLVFEFNSLAVRWVKSIVETSITPLLASRWPGTPLFD